MLVVADVVAAEVQPGRRGPLARGCGGRRGGGGSVEAGTGKKVKRARKYICGTLSAAEGEDG